MRGRQMWDSLRPIWTSGPCYLQGAFGISLCSGSGKSTLNSNYPNPLRRQTNKCVLKNIPFLSLLKVATKVYLKWMGSFHQERKLMKAKNSSIPLWAYSMTTGSLRRFSWSAKCAACRSSGQLIFTISSKQGGKTLTLKRESNWQRTTTERWLLVVSALLPSQLPSHLLAAGLFSPPTSFTVLASAMDV